LFGLKKIKRGKNRGEKFKKNLSCYEEKFFLPNMREKLKKNLFLVTYQKRQID